MIEEQITSKNSPKFQYQDYQRRKKKKKGNNDLHSQYSYVKEMRFKNFTLRLDLEADNLVDTSWYGPITT